MCSHPSHLGVRNSLFSSPPPPSPLFYISVFSFLPFLRFLWVAVFSLVVMTEPYCWQLPRSAQLQLFYYSRVMPNLLSADEHQIKSSSAAYSSVSFLARAPVHGLPALCRWPGCLRLEWTCLCLGKLSTVGGHCRTESLWKAELHKEHLSLRSCQRGGRGGEHCPNVVGWTCTTSLA